MFHSIPIAHVSLADPRDLALLVLALLAGAMAASIWKRRRRDREKGWTGKPVRSAAAPPARNPADREDDSRTIAIKSTAELALAQLGAIVESSDDAIIGKKLDGTITSWNRTAERLFGYTAAEAIGKSIMLIVPPERHDEETSILKRLSQGERIDHFETERVTRDGRRVPLSLTVSPIKDSKGRIIGASKSARDISERKRAEKDREQLLEAERCAREEAQRVNQMKDEFLATLSHELRTPLNAILGWAQLLCHGGMSATDVKQGVEVIERNARMQNQLIEDLLDMSRIISGKLRLDIQRVSPASFIEAAIETVSPAAQAKGIRIEKLLDLSSGPVSGDPGRLQQVLWNLLSNAVKFTPKGGKIQVLLERVNSHLEISVADTGEGIEPEFLPHMFERFRQADASTTRKFGGLGLGLAIVKQLVELHGGQVRVKSPGRGKGATFVVHLPLVVVHPDANPDDRVHPRAPSGFRVEMDWPDLSGLKVLVVDDESDAQVLICRLLKDCGAEVRTAGSADDAMPLLSDQSPDVLISDIGMPGIDGYEFLRRVRLHDDEQLSRVPAVALTAFARSEDRTRALRAGFLAHVAKPVEPAELIATIAAVTGRVRQFERGQ